MYRFVVLIACCLAAGAIRAQAIATPPLTATEQDTLLAIEITGDRMARHDRAAWMASDALITPDGPGRDARVRGWVTSEHPDGIEVVFLDASSTALYRVRVDGAGRAGAVERKPAVLDAFETGAAQARALAMGSGFTPCAARYNPIVLPADDGPDRWTVYLIPAMTDRNIVPFGGAYRLEIADGHIVSQRPYTRSCVQARRSAGDGAPKALWMTHLLDPLPTELHVFWSITTGLPMVVGTSAGDWKIESGHPRLLERRPPAID